MEQLAQIKGERDYAIRKGKILERFQEEFFMRHKNNDLFRKTLELLIRDADPYEIIEKLIEINHEAYQKITEIMPYVSPQYNLDKKP